MKKEKHDQYLPYLFLVGIVAIVAIVALVFFANGIEGAQIYKNTVDELQYPCVDSDPQNDYYTAGTVTFGRIEYLDFCTEEKVLHEYQCSTSNTPEQTREYACANGCVNGVCLK